MNAFLRRLLSVALPISALAGHAGAGDWPQFLGPTRDGHAAADAALLTEFPGGEPETVWRAKVGSGYAGPTVAHDTVYVFHRLGDKAVLQALKATDGAERWRFEYATDYEDAFNFDDGPRAVPLVADGRVYVYGAEGMLHCVDAATGKPVWKIDTATKWSTEKGFFGRACSPLLHGGVLMLQVGGTKGAGIVGFDPATGAVKWQATDHEAGYASPVPFGEKAAFFTREGFVLLDPATGEITAEKKHRAAISASVNAASPVVAGEDRVFLSACYDVGAALWKVDGSIKEIWAEGERLDCHFGTPVLVNDRLYGFHGRQERGAELRCISATDGNVIWASPSIGTGHVIAVGETLAVLTEKGELLLQPTGGDAFAPTLRAQILGAGIRAAPAFADGCLFARDGKNLICVRLGEK